MIDAGHDYNSVKKDIEEWWPKVKIGGVMGGDDYAYSDTNEVKLAVEEFCKTHNLELQILDNFKRNSNRISKVKNWMIEK